MTTKPNVTFVVPQFNRSSSDPVPSCPPEDFDGLRTMSVTSLREMGARVWDKPNADGKVLMLFPAEWYRHIPDGYEMESIMGRAHIFCRGTTSDDTRGGLLAFGIRVQP